MCFTDLSFCADSFFRCVSFFEESNNLFDPSKKLFKKCKSFVILCIYRYHLPGAGLVHLPGDHRIQWITITMPKYKIQTKTEKQAPLLAGLSVELLKKEKNTARISNLWKYKNATKYTKKYKIIQIQFPVRSGAINPGANYITFHSPLIYRPTNKEKLMFAIFLEEI